MGREGALLLRNFKNHVEIKHIPTLDVPAVDTTGAGDAFAAAVLYGLCKGIDIKKAILLGCLIGAYVVRGYGPRHLPSRNQIKDWVKEYLEGK